MYLIAIYINALLVFQKLHEYHLGNDDITIHYTQLTIDPMTKMYINPPIPLIIKNQLVTTNQLKSNQLGHIYLRVPLNNDTVQSNSVTITYGNTSTLLYLDTESHYQVYDKYKSYPKFTVEFKLSQVSGYTFNKQQSNSKLSLDLSFIPRSKTNKVQLFFQQAWDWILKAFEKVQKFIVDMIQRARIVLNWTNIKANRIVMWHHMKLLHHYGLKMIDLCNKHKWMNLTKPIFEVFNKPEIELKTENHLMLGTLLEHANDQPSMPHIIDEYRNNSNAVKSGLSSVNTSDLNINISKQDVKEMSLNPLSIFGKIFGFFKETTFKLHDVLSKIIQPLIYMFATVQFKILAFPLKIPGLDYLVKTQFQDSLRIADFFLLPLAIKINRYFEEFKLYFDPSELIIIKEITVFEDYKKLPESTLMKIHYADRLAWSFSYLFLIPFSTLQAIPTLSWLNPLWNIANFILNLFGIGRKIFNATITKRDATFHVSGLFGSFLSFIPSSFALPIPYSVITSMQAVLSKMPSSLSLLDSLAHVNTTEIYDKYPNPSLMKGMAGAVYGLWLAWMFTSAVPYANVISIVIMATLSAISDSMIYTVMQWKMKYALP